MKRESKGKWAVMRRVVQLIICLPLLVVALFALKFLYFRFIWEYSGPKMPISKETTFVTEPVDEEGYLDFESALNDRLKQAIIPEKNANVLLWKALGPKPEGGNGMPIEYFQQLQIEEPPADGDYFVGFNQFLRQQQNPGAPDAKIDTEQQEIARKRPWHANEYPHIAAWLIANEKPLAVVIEATRRSEYFNPLVSRRVNGKPTGLLSALLPNVQKNRELASALLARAMRRTTEGKFDEAWEDLQACHRLGRLVGRGATLIEALVAIAINQMASTADLAYLERANLSARQIEERLKDLRALPPLPNMAKKVDLGERFIYLDIAQMIRRGEFQALNGTDSIREDLARRNLDRIDWTPVFRNGMRMYDRLADAMRLQDRAERQRQLVEIETEVTQISKASKEDTIFSGIFSSNPSTTTGTRIGGVLMGLLVPANSKVQNAADRAEQTQRNLHLAFALAAYRADHGGYPAKLVELAPKYLPVIPDDLFSGAMLAYQPSENGYILYSVGENGKDDGGRMADDAPPGDDLGVRMPLPMLKKN